ncbi:unnamed protein product [Closterium sp. Yama58-4]|nr:unnamed protein product [Closterium sp. Yama58-4]
MAAHQTIDSRHHHYLMHSSRIFSNSTAFHVALLALVLAAWVATCRSQPALPQPTSPKCDYSDGEWTYSKTNPRYRGCPYIREIFDCRDNGRGDRQWEKQKWSPRYCAMKYFNAARFQKLMANKTIAFVGDSLMSNMWESFSCLLWGYHVKMLPVQQRLGPEAKFTGFHLPLSNTTILYHFSSYLTKATRSEGRDPLHGGRHGYTVDIDVVDPVLSAAVSKADAVVLTSGMWWQANVPGRKATNIYKMQGVDVLYSDLNAYKKSLYTVRELLLKHKSSLLSYYISFSPQHKFEPRYASMPGACGYSLPLNQSAAKAFLNNQAASAITYEAAQRQVFSFPTPVRLIDITEISAARPDGHVGQFGAKGGLPAGQVAERGDCRHWCLPGVPDAWVDLLYTAWESEPALVIPANKKE